MENIKKLIEYSRLHCFDQATGTSIKKSYNYLDLINKAYEEVRDLEREK